MMARSSPTAARNGAHDHRWWGQLLRYGAVSVVALVVDLGLFLGLAGSGVGAVPAAIAGYAVGLAVHFLLSSSLVFDAARTGKGRSRLFGEYVLSGIAGMLVTAATVAMLVEVAGLAPVPGKAVAVLLSFVTVFVIRRSIVFAARPA